MGTFSMSEADNYGGGGAGSFFTLKDDKDTARVRFLYGTIDDVRGYAVHRVQVGDKERYVNCLRDYREPLEVCPFCAAQLKVVPKLFIKLYNETEGSCQIWERGKNYFQRLASLATRYNPLYNQIVEIERSGKKGDMQTTYEFYPIENAPTDINSYDCAEPLGTIILDKSAEDMEVYLSTGAFPDTNNGSSAPQPAAHDEGVGRRTPNNTGARRAF